MVRQYCIVIPFYNHAKALIPLVERLLNYELKILIVNDGSTPEETAVVHDLALRFKDVCVVDHTENRGKGAAVLTGLREAHNSGFQYAIQIDADGQHADEDIPLFVSVSKENPAAVVLGIPMYDSSMPKSRLIARYLTHVWIWIETLSFTIRDSMCGFRVYPLDIVVPLADRVQLGTRMDFDPEVLVRLYWDGTPMVGVPTRVTYPSDGLSHFLLWRDNWLITKMHTKLFFGMLIRLPFLMFRSVGVRAGTVRNDRVGR